MPSPDLLSNRRRSYASLILEANGICQAKLADLFEVSTSSLSRMLRGDQPLPHDFSRVLRAAIGPQAAEQVVTAVGREVPR